MTWLFEKIKRVPSISDAQIKLMRHIEPLVKVPSSCMYRRIAGAGKIHPRNVSFLFAAEPTGDEFTFDTLNVSTIITQHHSAMFFKPSLAEVYAWIRIYLGENWREVSFFCMGEHRRIGSCTDVACDVEVMGGPILVRGQTMENGMYELVRAAP